MKTERLAIALTAVNLVLLLFMLARAGPTSAQSTAAILRGQAFELVDARGQVRSRLNVEPDGAVVFRLLDENGTIRVKLGADADGSGLLLANDATEPGVHMLATSAGSSLKLRDKDGRETVIAPQKASPAPRRHRSASARKLRGRRSRRCSRSTSGVPIP